MNPNKVLDEVKDIIGERGKSYGGIEDNFQRAANTAKAAGIDVGAYEVAMILASVKLARMSASPSKRDNYLDAIAYICFAAELIGAE
jgi:hypothetical protein